MALTGTGRTALSAILEHESLFPRIKDTDLVLVASKLARKQVTAAGLTRDDLLELKTTLGEEVFEKTLDGLSPHHIKLLARRLDKTAPEIEVNTGSSALSYVRQILAGDIAPAAAPAQDPKQAETAKKKNKYLGRKAFRTGR
ncbi:MAG: hypothetical protein NXH72_09975 [Hyphomonadaceae bacterium]|nr:hypothetical protein [Hyphomonadaceae bacterium]